APPSPAIEDFVPPSSSRPPVLVTGGAGYIGSVTVARLLERGHRVRVLDNLLFGDDALAAHRSSPDLELLSGDVRDAAAVARACAGIDGILHLAGLVGDPACALDPALTRAVNVDSTITLAEAAKAAGVRRLVFASTCSVYGAAGEAWLDEQSATGPVSLYAESNLESETLFQDRLQGSGVEPVTLRFATVFGVSPRMRFDLVVNLLTARALREGVLEVHGGEQWRPQVHVDDVASALLLALDQPRAAGRTYNVGSDALNLRIGELAQAIAARFPAASLTVSETRDPRSYRVSFARITDELGFRAEHSIDAGVAEIADWIHARSGFDPAAVRYSNVRTLEAALR
ncbi:MAG: SDR family oxidoreductase, partial [Candidatus Eisenbacteria bacterium]